VVTFENHLKKKFFQKKRNFYDLKVQPAMSSSFTIHFRSMKTLLVNSQK